jgi:hypothetical protein
MILKPKNKIRNYLKKKKKKIRQWGWPATPILAKGWLKPPPMAGLGVAAKKPKGVAETTRSPRGWLDHPQGVASLKIDGLSSSYFTARGFFLLGATGSNQKNQKF